MERLELKISWKNNITIMEEGIMDIRYDLSQEEVEEVQFSARLISNRQSRPYYFQPGEGKFEQSYAGFRRRDMFWIDCQLDDTNLGSLVVEPHLKDPTEFTLERNNNKVVASYQELINRAYTWFSNIPEYQQQITWTRKLAERIKKDEEEGFEDRLVSKSQ